jgi:hypothetical protein
MGCKNQGAKTRAIVIQLKRRGKGCKPTHVFKTRIVGAD